MYLTAPALLAANVSSVFDADQLGQVSTLAFGWQDWLHTFKFAQPPHGVPYDDAQRLAAEQLTRLADVWWKTDATRARECINMALDHACEAKADSSRWDVQTDALRCWAKYGDAEDWKNALACWRWGPAFLDAADSFVARWSVLQDRGYAESQNKAIEWAHTVSGNVLNAI